ncbi:MAG: DUF2634 domain-containing protein [Lachnospirales bacterium]
MGLIPENSENSVIEEKNNLTYYIDFNTNKTFGYCDKITALKQAIFKILSTERYDYVIYDRNYGIEIKDLIGKSDTYVSAVIKGRIKEALTYDDRILDVYDFEITRNKNSLLAEFSVSTIYGNDNVVKEFAI